jgi:dihydrofolate reductase
MDAVIGLGAAGCNIADQFAKYPQYKVYKIDVGLESLNDLSGLVYDEAEESNVKTFSMPLQLTSEDYEKNCPPMKTFFEELKDGDNVLFVVAGGGKITGASLRVLETIKNCKLSVMYVKPDLQLIGGKKYILDRISYYVLQEYARSGMFERMYLTYNPSIENATGDVAIKGYFDELNKTIVSTHHMINIFNNTKPVFENKSDTEEHVRISTCGVVDPESGEERLFFPLENITDKTYYIAVNKEVLEDKTFFKELKENMKKKAEQQGVGISYVINETEYEDSYVYVVAHSDEPQGEDALKNI